MPQSELEKTISYNEYMRPFHAERELLAAMGTSENILGFFSVSRSTKEKSFSDDELSYFVKIRDRAETKLESTIHYQPDISDSNSFSMRLKQHYLSLTFCSMNEGNLVWLSQEGLLRLQTRLCRSIFGNNFVSDPRECWLGYDRWQRPPQTIREKRSMDRSSPTESFLDNREGS